MLAEQTSNDDGTSLQGRWTEDDRLWCDGAAYLGGEKWISKIVK